MGKNATLLIGDVVIPERSAGLDPIGLKYILGEEVVVVVVVVVGVGVGVVVVVVSLFHRRLHQ